MKKTTEKDTVIAALKKAQKKEAALQNIQNQVQVQSKKEPKLTPVC